MTQIFDNPADFADEALDGFVAANRGYVARVDGGVVRSTEVPSGQVALVVGGEEQERHHELPLVARARDAVGRLLRPAEGGHEDRDQDGDDADDDEQLNERKSGVTAPKPGANAFHVTTSRMCTCVPTAITPRAD